MDFFAHPWPFGAFCFVVGFLLARWIYFRPSSEPAFTPRTDITDAEIETALRNGNKVEAIRLYRQRSGCGVKEAKQAVEAMADHLGRR